MDAIGNIVVVTATVTTLLCIVVIVLAGGAAHPADDVDRAGGRTSEPSLTTLGRSVGEQLRTSCAGSSGPMNDRASGSTRRTRRLRLDVLPAAR